MLTSNDLPETKNKYSALADSLDVDLLPFAADVYGALGKQALELLRWICAEGRASGRFTTRDENDEFRNGVFTSISVAVQRAAAMCALEGVRIVRGGPRLRGASGPSRLHGAQARRSRGYPTNKKLAQRCPITRRAPRHAV